VNERLRILQSIESGQISVEEGVQRLEKLSCAESGLEPELEDQTAGTPPADVTEPPAELARPPFVRTVWQIVFGLGIAIVAAGGLLLARAYGREGMSGLAWGWVLFVLGVVVMVLGWWLQRASWFYLRVREHDGTGFAIALPLPLSLVGWLLRVAEPFVPQLREVDAHRLILTMRDELRDGRGMVVKVDEGEAGDQVEIYFR